jgi:hypothetical protein
MAENSQEYTLKLIADAKGLAGGLSDGERAVKKLEKSVDELTKANKEVTEAAEKLTKAQTEGSEEAIKNAEKELAKKQKLAEKAEQNLQRQVQQTQKIVDAENKKIAAETRELGVLEKLEKELKELREAQRKATDPKQVIEYTNQIKNLENEIKELNEVASEDDLEDLNDKLGTITQFGPEATQGLSGIAGEIINIGKTAGPAGIAVAALLAVVTGAVAAAASAAKETADYAKEQQNLQRATGVSASLLATLSEGLKRNGGDAGDTADVLLQLGGVLQTALADPTGEVAKGFEELGVSLFDLNGNAINTEQLFRQLDKSAQGAGLSQEQLINLAGKLGEDASKKILPLLGTFESLEEQVNRTGLVLGQDTTKEASKLTAGLAEVQSILTGVALSIGSEFLPAFNAIIAQVKQSFASLSESQNFKDGFQAIIDLVKDFISTAGPQLVIIIEGIISFIGRLGIVIGTITLGYTTLRDAIFGVDEAGQKQAETSKLQAYEIGRVAQQAATQTAEIEGLKKKTEELNAVQQASIGVQKALSDLRIQALEIAKERGLLSEEELIKETIEKQIESAKKQLEIAENLRKEREAIAQKELANKKVVSNQTKIELFQAQQAELEATRELSKLQFDLQTKPVQAAIEQNLEDLEQGREKRALILAKQIKDIDEAEKEGVKSHEQAVKERLEITKKGIQEEIAELDKILANNNLLNDKREELEKQRVKLTNDLEKVEIDSSSRIKDAKIKDLQDAFNKAKDLADAEANFKQAEFERRQAQINSIKDLDLQAIQQRRLDLDIAQENERQALVQISLEEKQLQLLKDQKATQEEITLQESKISLAIAASNAAREESISKLKALRDEQAATFNEAAKQQEAYANALAGTTEGFIKRNQELSNIITEVAKQFEFAFDPSLADNSNVQAATEQLEKYREILAATEQDLLTGSGVANSILVFQRELALSNIQKLENDISIAAQRIAAETAAENNRIREEKARELQQSLLELQRETNEEIQDLERETQKELRDLAKERNDEIEDFNEKQKENFNQLQQDKLDLVQEFDEKEREIAEQALEDEIERQRELIETKEDLALDSADRLNKIERDALIERAKLEAQLLEEKDPEKRKELEDKLKGITQKSDKEIAIEKEKQAEIEKAIEESKTEEELKIRLDAINKKFDLLKDEQKQREELIKSGNAKELAEFDRLIEEQKKRDQDRLAKELERLAQQQQLKKEQAERERAERLAEQEQRLKDLEDNYNKEKEDEEKRHQERLEDLKKRQDEIKKEYKQTLEQITNDQTKAAQSLVDSAGLANDAFNQFFKTGLTEGSKFSDLLDEINKKLGNISQTAGASSSSSSSSSSSTSSSSSSSSSNSNGIFSSPNSTEGAGNLGNFIQQAPGQDQGSNTSNENTTSNANSNPNSGNTANNTSNNSLNSDNTSSGLSSSSNQNNTNNEIESQGSGQIDDSVPKTFASVDEYKSRMIKLHKNLLDSAGIDRNKLYSTLFFGSGKGLEARGKAKQTGNALTYVYGRGIGVDDKSINSSLVAVSFLQYGSATAVKKDKGFKYSYKDSQKIFEDGLNKLIDLLEKAKPKSKFDEDLDTTANPNLGGATPNVNAPTTTPSSSGRGDTPQPSLPTSNPTANIPSGLSDKEKAFFAARALDERQGSFKGEGAEAEGFVRFGPNFSGSTAPTAEEALAGKGTSDVVAGQQTQANATIQQGLVLQSGAIQINASAATDQVLALLQSELTNLIQSGEFTNALKPQMDKQFQTNLLARNGQNAIKLS